MLITPGRTICSDQLLDNVGYYSQFEICEAEASTDANFCSNQNTITAMMRSQVLKPEGISADGTKDQLCHYHVFNPNPRRSVLVNIYA